MIMIQLNLVRAKEESMGVEILNTWVPYDKRLVTGLRITLKGDDREWTINQVHETQVEMSEIDHRGWDNNNYDKHESKSFKERT